MFLNFKCLAPKSRHQERYIKFSDKEKQHSAYNLNLNIIYKLRQSNFKQCNKFVKLCYFNFKIT